MGLSRSVFNHCSALGKHGCNHDIHRGADRNLVQVDAGTVQPAVKRIGIHKTALDIDIGTQGTHALDVLVDGANAEIAAAGHGCLGAAEAAQHGTDQVIGSTDFAHQLKGSILAARIRTVDFDGIFIDITDSGTQLDQDGQKGVGIADLRNIFNTADAFYQECCGNNGNRSVFGAADFHLTTQSRTAVYDILIHGTPSHTRLCNTALNGNITI